MVRTAAIGDLVDPHAAYTLEYLDMILSLKAQNRRVVFVPTARLEFRIAEFSWRDVPYFMYKRSEATCHGTRDYLSKKWRAHFPNTGFWTYIKYTIVESHTYSSLEKLPLKYQLQLFLAFFQMAGYNRYDGSSLCRGVGGHRRRDAHYSESERDASHGEEAHLRHGAEERDGLGPVTSGSKGLAAGARGRPAARVHALRYDGVRVAVHMRRRLVRARCPFSGSRRWRETCLAQGDGPGQFPRDLCGVAVEKGSGEHCHDGDCHSHHEHGEALAHDHGAPESHEHDHGHGHGHDGSTGCECYVNLPTFKSRNWVGDVLAKIASLLKVPSRVTTYLELFLGSDHAAAACGAPHRRCGAHRPTVGARGARRLHRYSFYTSGGAATATSDVLEPRPAVPVAFGEGDRVVHFSGRPAAPGEVVGRWRRSELSGLRR